MPQKKIFLRLIRSNLNFPKKITKKKVKAKEILEKINKKIMMLKSSVPKIMSYMDL